MPPAEHQGLKRPDRPERYQRHNRRTFKYDALPALELQIEVAAQQARPAARAEFFLSLLLARRQIGQFRGGPDLAMRMRIAGAHQLAAVFEYLDVPNARFRAQLTVL